MLSTLILNKNKDPIDIVSGRRAIALIDSGKAHALELSEQVLMSANKKFTIPYIIQLNKQVNVSTNRYTPFSHKGVLYRDNYTCVYCKNSKGDTIDHVIPKSKGGVNSYANCVAACKSCNSFKSDMFLEDLGWDIPDMFTPRWYEIAMKRKSVTNEQRSIWVDYISVFDPSVTHKMGAYV